MDVADVAARLAVVRAASALPVGVGFGIRDPRSAAEVGRFADAVIVGSAIVERMAAKKPIDEVLADVEGFVRDLRAALPERVSGMSS